MANGKAHTNKAEELTELDWLLLGELCKGIIGPRHEIDRSRYALQYQDPNEAIDEQIQDKIDQEEQP